MRTGLRAAKPPDYMVLVDPRRSPFWRYTAFQVPGWVLAAAGGWWLYTSLSVPTWVAGGVLIIWVIKDIALYPLLRSAYVIDDVRPIEQLVGRVGIAAERLAPHGYIRVRGELWRAEVQGVAAVEPDAAVEVVDTDGMRLKVRPRETAAPDTRENDHVT